MNNFLLIFIFILFIIVIVISIYLLYMYFRFKINRDKYFEIKNSINNFNLNNLKEKYKKIKHKNSISNEMNVNVEDIEILITKFEKRSLKDYQNSCLFIDQRLSKWFLPTKNDIKRDLQGLDDLSFEYIKNYLSILFLINEILLSNEIQDLIIEKLRNIFFNVSSITKNSNYSEIYESNQFTSKIQEINKKIKIIENESNKKKLVNDYEVSPLIISYTKKLLLEINIFLEDSLFILNSLNFLKKKIIKKFELYDELYSKDKKIFNSLNNELKNNIQKIKHYKQIIFKDIFLLKKESVKKNIDFLDEIINNQLKQLFLNKESYFFIKKYEKQIISIINEFQSMKENIISEIKKYKVLDKDKKIDVIFEKTEDLNKQLHNYLKLRSDTFAKHSPYSVSVELTKLIEIYKDCLSYIVINVKDVKEIINETNIVNNYIAKINISLLDMETKINTLPENIKYNKKNKMTNYQEKSSKLIEIFRNNKSKIDYDKKQEIIDLYLKIENFKKDIETYSFITEYVKWVIIELNKNISFDEKYFNLISKIENKYNNSNFIEALRLSNSILDIYKIYE